MIFLCIETKSFRGDRTHNYASASCGYELGAGGESPTILGKKYNGNDPLYFL